MIGSYSPASLDAGKEKKAEKKLGDPHSPQAISDNNLTL